MIQHLEEIYNTNLDIDLPAIQRGIDYKMSAIKSCVKELEEIEASKEISN